MSDAPRDTPHGTVHGSVHGALHDPLHDKGPLLGRQVSGSASYDPSLLFPVPRAGARASLPGAAFCGFGEDVWHAYELSWLVPNGMPVSRVGTLRIPASSPNLVESKSLKLYLNSLNNHSFADCQRARDTIVTDIAAVVGAEVSLELHPADSERFAGVALPGRCLDELCVPWAESPDAQLLQGMAGERVQYTHLMRSLCPVTAQPDWATLVVESCGVSPTAESLLAYLLGYRNHREFHEQCVERIFTDLQRRLNPGYLSVQALYTRRGGLDICPWRCSRPEPAGGQRIHRQ